jgi:hypothetical protein
MRWGAGATPSCIALQRSQGLGTPAEPFKACTFESCSKWCQQEFGRSVASVGFGCQSIEGMDALAFCECSDGGRTEPYVVREVLCHEPAVCPKCANGYCSTSPEKNEFYNFDCVMCEPGFVLLPTGVCVAEALFDCPLSNPCLNGGECVVGSAELQTSFSCACKDGFEGPLCNSGSGRLRCMLCLIFALPKLISYIVHVYLI